MTLNHTGVIQPPIDAADTVPREPGCECQWEAGDSPCPVHGDAEGMSANVQDPITAHLGADDPDADRPCSCEESERLRETIALMRKDWFSPAYGVRAAERLRKAEERVAELEQSQERLANGLFRADQFGQEQLARVRELEEQLLETKEALERRGG